MINREGWADGDLKRDTIRQVNVNKPPNSVEVCDGAMIQTCEVTYWL